MYYQDDDDNARASDDASIVVSITHLLPNLKAISIELSIRQKAFWLTVNNVRLPEHRDIPTFNLKEVYRYAASCSLLLLDENLKGH